MEGGEKDGGGRERERERGADRAGKGKIRREGGAGVSGQHVTETIREGNRKGELEEFKDYLIITDSDLVSEVEASVVRL